MFGKMQGNVGTEDDHSFSLPKITLDPVSSNKAYSFKKKKIIAISNIFCVFVIPDGFQDICLCH